MQFFVESSIVFYKNQLSDILVGIGVYLIRSYIFDGAT